MTRIDASPAERLMQHTRAISGPRLPGSPGEARAAGYVAAVLRRLGLAPQVESFRAVADTNWLPISAALATLAGLAAFPWSGWLGVALAAMAPVLLWYAFTRADSPIRALLPQVESRTVWARIPPRGEPKGKVALLAHLDANRCRLAWRAGGGRAIRLGSALTLFVGAAVPALLATAALAGRPGPYLAALLGGGYALANTAVLLWELRLPPSPGANDNAASVAVVLALAERIIGTPLEHTEVWLLFTGAEESDHRGIKEALRRHPELAWARFLVLEGVGAGELSYLTREGVLVPYRPAPELLGLVAQVGRRSGVGGREVTVVCETQTLRRWGLPAVTIAGYDPEARSLPHWHTCQDAPENLSPGAMSRALDFLGALLHALDGANGTGRP